MSDTFIGFDEPKENWSKLPHALIEAFPLMTSEAELRVVLYVLRHTWGYHDEDKRISIDEFSKGRKKRDGSRIDGGTGLSENAVRDGIRRAKEHGFIEFDNDARDQARVHRYYRLKMREDAESDPPPVRVQSLNPSGAESEALDSESEPRSEKETDRNTPGEETSSASPRPPRARDEMFDAICDVCRVDAKTAGATVGKVKANLVKADYSAADVRQFGVWWWADKFRRQRDTPPTVWQLVERIGVIRSGSGNQGSSSQCANLAPWEVAAQRALERENGNGEH